MLLNMRIGIRLDYTLVACIFNISASHQSSDLFDSSWRFSEAELCLFVTIYSLSLLSDMYYVYYMVKSGGWTVTITHLPSCFCYLKHPILHFLVYDFNIDLKLSVWITKEFCPIDNFQYYELFWDCLIHIVR